MTAVCFHTVQTISWLIKPLALPPAWAYPTELMFIKTSFSVVVTFLRNIYCLFIVFEFITSGFPTLANGSFFQKLGNTANGQIKITSGVIYLIEIHNFIWL